jgi:hypothetical protein
MSNHDPSTTGGNGRGSDGRFGPGNRCARGNPHAKKVAQLRGGLLAAVTVRDVRDVARALLRSAKEGDVAAARELLQRLLGPPVELDLLERMHALEQTIADLIERDKAC